MVSGAIYDAVNDIERTGSVLQGRRRGTGRGLAFGRGLGGRLHVLSALDPKMQPLLNEVAMAQSMAAVPSDVGAWQAGDAGRPRGGARASSPGGPTTGRPPTRPLRPRDRPRPVAAHSPRPIRSPGGRSGATGRDLRRHQARISDLPAARLPRALDSPRAYAAALNQVESLGALTARPGPPTRPRPASSGLTIRSTPAPRWSFISRSPRESRSSSTTR